MIDRERLAKLLMDRYKIVDVAKDYSISYENQYLNTAILLVQGCINIYKKNKLVDSHSSLSFIGLEEFLFHKKYAFRIEIKKGSKLVFLTNSEKAELGLVAES